MFVRGVGTTDEAVHLVVREMAGGATLGFNERHPLETISVTSKSDINALFIYSPIRHSRAGSWIRT